MTKGSWLLLASLLTACGPETPADKDTDVDTDSQVDTDPVVAAPVVTFADPQPTTLVDLQLVIQEPAGTTEIVVQWTQDGASRPDLRDATTVPASQTRKGEVWVATVLAVTAEGNSEPVRAEVTVVNSPPSATLAIEPMPSLSTSDLDAIFQLTDDDGDVVTATLSWTRDGGPTGFTGPSVPAGSIAKDEVWQVTLVPNDGEVDGEPVTASTTVVNAPPVVTEATLAPLQPRTNATLQATVRSVDADGDSPLTPTISWFVNDPTTPVRSGSSPTLTGANFVKGDQVWFSVTVSDGLGSSAPFESNRVTILNTAPEAASVALGPADPDESTTLTCTPTGWYDEDGDAEQYLFAWTKGGVSVPNATSSTLTGADFNRGDSVRCVATPFDGTAAGLPLTSNPVSVGNAPPTLANVSVNTPVPRAGDTVLAVLGPVSDLDGDVVRFRYQWRIDGTDVPGATSASFTGGFVRGDLISVVVTPFDNFDDGPPVTSAEVLVANSLPVTDTLAVTPQPAYVDDDLLAVASASDADGQPVTLRYQWRVGSNLVRNELDAEGDGDVLDSSFFVAGDRVTVSAVPNDGLADGQPRSEAVTIANSLPSITSVQIDPANPVEASTITCTPQGWSDADGTSPGYRYVWHIGVRILPSPVGTLTGAEFAKGDEIWCEAIPFDGQDEGAAVESPRVTVRNTPPVLAGATLTTVAPASDETIGVVLGAVTDADNDAVTYQYAWQADGVPVGASGPTVSANLFDPGQSIRCLITPFDDEEAGESVLTDEAFVQNTAPVVQGVTLAPLNPTTTQPIVATVTAQDDDGDELTFTYAWTRNEDPEPTVTGDTFPPELTVRGDRIAVVVTADDGFGGLDDGSAGPVQVVNSPPTSTSATIQPAVVREGTGATCVGGGWSDPDGDAESYDYVWFINNIQSTTQQTLPDTAYRRGDTLRCRATPNDRNLNGRGMGIDSAPVTVANSAPVLASATITPTGPTVGDEVSVTLGAATDADNDPVTLSYAWTVDGAPAGTGPTLDLAPFAKGQSVGLSVTPTDNLTPGTPVVATPVTILNSPPVVQSVRIEPVGPTVGTSLTASAVVEDLDLDALVILYAWYVDDVLVQEGPSEVLPGSFVASGGEIYVEVTADDGEAISDTVASIRVVIGNAAPLITGVVLSPTTVFETTVVTCTPQGWFDPDGDPPGYVYEWRVNGVPRAATQTLRGNVFNKNDQIQCIVTPTDQASFGNPVSSEILTVLNSPPTAASVQLTRTSPREGDTVSVAVLGQADADGDTITRTVRWLVNGVEVLTAPAIGSDLFDKGDTLQALVNLSDGTASIDLTTATTTAVNTAPFVSSVVLTPTQAYVDDDLTVSATVVDPDPADQVPGVLDVVNTWYINDAPIAALTGDTLLAGTAVKRDEVRVEVVASDGASTSATGVSNTVTILNTLPVLATVRIEPSPVDRNHPPTCVYEGAFDLDGDTVVPSYRWTVNGTFVSGAPGLAPSSYARGQRLVCEVTPMDDDGSGLPVASDEVIVGNALPLLDNVFISPASPRETDVVGVVVVAGATDADGDLLTWTYRWLVNGVQVGTGPQIDGTSFNRGDLISVEVTPFDGREVGEVVVAGPATAINTPPVLNPTIVITPSQPRTVDDLTVSATATDADGDVPTFRYAFSVNGSVVQDGSSPTLSSSFTSRGSVVRVTVTPNDGFDDGGSRTGPAVTVVNTPPTPPTVTVNPQEAVPGIDDLVCSISSPGTDADGDSLRYEFRWRVLPTGNGTQVDTATTSTMDAFFLFFNEEWVCEARSCDANTCSPWSEGASAITGIFVLESCKDYYLDGERTTGVYTIDPDGPYGSEQPYDVYCDMATSEGGWTRVIRTDGQDENYGQRTAAIVSASVGVTATRGVYEAFERQRDFSQIMLKQVSGSQAGQFKTFTLFGVGPSLLEMLEICRDQPLALNDDFAYDGGSTFGHRQTFGGTGADGTLGVVSSVTGVLGNLGYMHICGLNPAGDNDVSYLAFTDETGAARTWGDQWRGTGQIGTIWSFANGNYCCSGNTHIGAAGLQTLAGWKGVVGTASGNAHAGTYEVYVK